MVDFLIRIAIAAFSGMIVTLLCIYIFGNPNDVNE